jgi:hypothetical protein
MAVGHPPFEGSDVGHQQAHGPVPLPGPGGRAMPDFLKTVILRLLEKDKAKRYPDAASVLSELQLKEVVPGITVGGRYEVLAEIGRGGMGTIFRARDTELDETVALKFLVGEIGAELAARFVQEIKTARRVNHPNVVRVFTLEKWQEHRFIVMEYIDGMALPRWTTRSPAPRSARARRDAGDAACRQLARRGETACSPDGRRGAKYRTASHCRSARTRDRGQPDCAIEDREG